MLTDGDITLRRPGEADVDALYEACQDPEIQRWTGVPSPYRREDAVTYVRDATPTSFLAVDADGAVLGSFSVMEIDGASGEIGYWVAPEARGKGVATRAVTLLRDWAVAELGLDTIELLIHTENVQSLRVAERTGFLDTGERRPAPRQTADAAPTHAVYLFKPA